jgi:hypothetical protein
MIGSLIRSIPWLQYGRCVAKGDVGDGFPPNIGHLPPLAGEQMMKSTLVFWRQQPGVSLSPAAIAQELHIGNEVDQLIDLPVREILERLKDTFPDAVEKAGELFWRREEAFERPGRGSTCEWTARNYPKKLAAGCWPSSRPSTARRTTCSSASGWRTSGRLRARRSSS